MVEAERDMRAVLSENVGFKDSDCWIEYARRHNFKAVKATRVGVCPDCAGRPRGQTWGQYIYYSTLIHLLECANCGLVWADAHIDQNTIRGHFEVAYNNQEYFRISRHPILDHLASVIANLSSEGARILDIGGARGDLMAQLVERRPDVRVVVHDIAESKTNWVAENLGFATLLGGVEELAAHQGKYEVLVLSDVLYYEPNLKALWDVISHLLSPGGSIVIRVPNKYGLISLSQWWWRLTRTRGQQAMQDRVRFYNPEHIFICRRQYLKNRLMTMGFSDIQVLPSPPLGSRRGTALKSLLFNFAKSINVLSHYKLVLTPAMVVIGRHVNT